MDRESKLSPLTSLGGAVGTVASLFFFVFHGTINVIHDIEIQQNENEKIMPNKKHNRTKKEGKKRYMMVRDRD